MPAVSINSDFLSALLGLAVVVIFSRLVRLARLSAPTQANTVSSPARTRRPRWGPARRLDKLNQNSALARAEAELIHHTIDQVQARHDLDRLMRELAPAPVAAGQVARAAVPSLTLAEIRALLISVDMPAELRTTLLQLLEATAHEKARA